MLEDKKLLLAVMTGAFLIYMLLPCSHERRLVSLLIRLKGEKAAMPVSTQI